MQRAIGAWLLGLLSCVSLAQGQTVTWHMIGQPLGLGLQCGYFWNRGEGVVVSGAGQFFYLRNGTWRTGLKLPYGSIVNSVRCFDGKTLYAPVLNRSSSNYYQLWQSTDSGITWAETSLHSATLGVDGADVYWDYSTNSPVMMGTTDVRLDSLDLISTFDYWDQGPPLCSRDGGHSWFWGPLIDSVQGYNYYCGFGACVDKTNKLYYAASESGYPGAFRSTDSGLTWTCVTGLPTNLYMMDDIEGIYDKTFIQTSQGMFETTDKGNTWDFIGGPGRLVSDDARFCVIGCTGQAVIAFDDGGGVWIANDWDAPDPAELRSNFMATPKECDTAVIVIAAVERFAPGRLLLSIENDSGGFFKLLTPDTIEDSKSESQIRIAFSSHDLVKHTAVLSIVPLDYGMCPMTHPIFGQSHLLPAKVVSPRPVLTCAEVTGHVSISNPNCEALHITLDSSNSPDLVVLAFDSTILDTGSMPFICPSLPVQGSRSYWEKIVGHFEPSGVPFDTTLWVTVEYGYVPSRLVASAYVVDVGTVNACTETDTAIVFENEGCDTLYVPMAQNTLGTGWTVQPNADTLRLLPGDVDTVRFSFSSIAPGFYPLRLTYQYLGRSPGSESFRFSATVAPAPPNVALSDTAFNLGTRSICANDTMLTIAFTNGGCDSVLISNATLDSGQFFSLLDANDTILPPEGTLTRWIAYHAASDGTAEQTLTLRISRTDSSLAHDTTISFSANVFGQRKQADAFPAAIDEGQLYTCEARDTFVAVQNTGCDTIRIGNLALSGTGFSITGGGTASSLPPGQSDTIWLRTMLDTTGRALANYDTLSIASNAVPALAAIPLTRGIAYPVAWAARLSAATSGTAGTEVTYQVLQTGHLPSDVTALDFTLSYEDDLLGFLGTDETSVTTGASWRNAAGIMHQKLRIAPIASDSLLATLHFLPYVAKDTATSIVLDSINFTSALDRPNDCIASASVVQSAFTLLPQCGTRVLREVLENNLAIDGIVPNPANDNAALIYSLQAAQALTARLTIEDALGRTVIMLSAALFPGSGRTIPLDLSWLPSGVYLIRLTVSGFERTARIIRE